MRIRPPTSTRGLIRWGQEGRCLLCPFPLSLRHHLHHVIAYDERGPDHPLNLVGLCPNHHAAVEIVRRHIAPYNTRRARGWMHRAEAALETVNALSATERELFNLLSEPHPLRKEIREGVDAKHRLDLAVGIAQADARVLLNVNRARPRILLAWRIARKEVLAPDNRGCLEILTNEARRAVTAVHLAYIVGLHLDALGLPFDPSWLSEL